MKPIIVVTEGLEEAPFAYLRQHATVREAQWSDGAALAAALKDADAAIVRTYTRVNGAFLELGARLRVVGRAGVGLDNIDIAACRERGVAVLSTPTANTRAVCEYVFNLIFGLGRPLVNVVGQATTAEEFHGYRQRVRGLELAGKTLGILGMGRIGRGVGKIGWAMEMEVMYNDLVDVSGGIDYPARSVEKGELYARADVLTVHVNHQPNHLNHHLVGAAALGQMKATAYLINTSRGEVVDAGALAGALRAGRLAGAALDVHEPEPPPAEYPLWGCPRLILAPHLAARTQGAMDRMSWVCRDVLEYLGAH